MVNREDMLYCFAVTVRNSGYVNVILCYSLSVTLHIVLFCEREKNEIQLNIRVFAATRNSTLASYTILTNRVAGFPHLPVEIFQGQIYLCCFRKYWCYVVVQLQCHKHYYLLINQVTFTLLIGLYFR
uniref:Uncharacterized protein n=1 Tax=Parascaris equorum TaxID=6256 RepID=A0A914SB44_PAREQ